MTDQMKISISTLIEECNNESDIDKKIQLFYKIHSMPFGMSDSCAFCESHGLWELTES
jgi:hypothetical protein